MKGGLVVYTAVFGAYDVPAKATLGSACDFICFTDDPGLHPEGWRVEVVKDLALSPADTNRLYKMLPHVYLKEYSRSLYVDGNIRLNKDPKAIFEKYANAAIAIPRHRERDCAYDEARACLDHDVIDADAYGLLIGEYARRGLPRHSGLTENHVLLRNHNDPAVARLMDEWWAEYRRWAQKGKSARDQTVLPYLLWESRIRVTDIAEGPRHTNRYFTINLHAAEQETGALRRLVRIAHKRAHLGLRYRLISSLARTVVRTMRKLGV